MTLREQARAILRRMVLPVPSREKSLVLIVPKGVVPPLGHRCLCSLVAIRYWRTAHENACTRIVVDDGTGHRHEFDTVALFTHIVRTHLGYVPPVQRVAGRVPRFLATAGAQAAGDQLDLAHRRVIPVPVAVSGDPGSGKD